MLDSDRKRNTEVVIAEFQRDIKATIDRLVRSNLNADQLLAVFAGTGVQPLHIVQSILVARYDQLPDAAKEDYMRADTARRSPKA